MGRDFPALMAGARTPRRTLGSTPPAEMESAVREKCLRLLAQMPRTRLELERALSRAGAPDDVVASVLDRFADVGLIDDTSYAEAYMRTGVGVRRRGTRSLRAELRVRGVAPDVIDVASGQVDEESERATALALASRRAAALSRLEPEVRRRRLTGQLLRRGFAPALVSSVIAEVLQGVMAVDELPEEDDGSAFGAGPDPR